MNVVGLITEYNPFHNGHLYHLREARRRSGAELVVVVMSGHFLQRGEAALVNKWARAHMAVSAGADMVLEIPTAFTVAGATSFAWGAVSLLQATGVVTHLCFGSESGDIKALQHIAAILADEPEELSRLIKEELVKGKSYPCALPAAFQRFGERAGIEHVSEILNTPNNILGIEYLKALGRLGSNIQPLTITRQSAGYHDLSLPRDIGIASATAIREMLKNWLANGSKLDDGNFPDGELRDGDTHTGYLTALKPFVPGTTLDILQEEFSAGRGPVFNDSLIPLLKYRLLTTAPDDLKETFDISEGLENRLKEMPSLPGDWNALLDALKTRRYSWTKLQRVLIQILLGYNKSMAQDFHRDGPGYLRLLAFSEKGRGILSRIKKEGTLPLVTNVAPFVKAIQEGACEVPPSSSAMLNMDILAGDVYSLLYTNLAEQTAGQDYLKGPVLKRPDFKRVRYIKKSTHI